MDIVLPNESREYHETWERGNLRDATVFVQWDDENGNDLGKGVSMIEINIDTSSANYGQIYMYDINHDGLTNGNHVKQHEYTVNP